MNEKKCNLNLQKFVIMLGAFILLFFTSMTPIANAKTIKNQNKKVEKLAEDLEFIMEKAAIRNSNDKVIDFDFDKLENRFGKLQEFKILKNEINNDKLNKHEINQKQCTNISNYNSLQAKSWNGWKSCMVDALKDHFGVKIIEIAFEGGLWGYLEKKAYKEAAKLLVKIAVGSNVLGVTSFLVYYGAKCAS
ncbi:hypothetical protein IKE_06466 [Bacillus cereus VD196]|uniref:Uncharacterized protein n=1 Tax=Bacillus cereus VD196 TaxID=1053243 RepID=A0A9W5PXA7_BACCE|nr:hypothetical protein [Bacillus cereus]EOO56600.1 hypothetical protein IKE_06466 [Bacillus cereus VD196]MDA2074674.1 hypothetical protein [Bacillus cereus]